MRFQGVAEAGVGKVEKVEKAQPFQCYKDNRGFLHDHANSERAADNKENITDQAYCNDMGDGHAFETLAKQECVLWADGNDQGESRDKPVQCDAHGVQ